MDIQNMTEEEQEVLGGIPYTEHPQFLAEVEAHMKETGASRLYCLFVARRIRFYRIISENMQAKHDAGTCPICAKI